MAHLINKIEQSVRPQVTVLSCMGNCATKKVPLAEAIEKRLEAAANARQKLDNEIAARDKKIEKSAQAKLDLKA